MEFRFSTDQERLRTKMRELADQQLIPRRAEFEAEAPAFHPQLPALLERSDVYPYFVPREYGGHGVSSVNVCIIREELCRACCNADTLTIFQGLGSYPIAVFGTEEQKRRFLPDVAAGRVYSAFCLTEPGAGTDVAGIEATARLEGDQYVLNGTKIYVANPPYASLFVVFAKTAPELKGKGISAFIVEKNTPGLRIEPMRLVPLHPQSRMIMEDCRLPKASLLGEPERGMRVALGNLDVFRPTVGAAAVGMAQSAFEEAVRFARERKAFGRTLSEFDVIAAKLAEMATLIDASRLIVFRAAWRKDAGEPMGKQASMAKLFATESAQKVIDEAVQIFGGRGVWEDSRVSFLYKAIRPLRIYEGTAEVQRMVIWRDILAKADTTASLSLL